MHCSDAYLLFSRAKARARKKAKVNKPAKDPIRDETEKTPEPSNPDVDNIPDGPSLPDQATEAEHMDVDPSAHTDDPPSPAKGADDDVVVTGTGHTSPSNPITLSKHSAKEEIPTLDKGKWKTDLQAMPTSTPKTCILDF